MTSQKSNVVNGFDTERASFSASAILTLIFGLALISWWVILVLFLLCLGYSIFIGYKLFGVKKTKFDGFDGFKSKK